MAENHFSPTYMLFSFITFIQLVSINGFLNKKDWEYTVLSTDLQNDHPEFLTVNFKHTRISRGTYGITGNFTINTDLFDEKAEATVKVFRSPRRDNNFQSLPFSVPKTKLFDYFNNEYKKFFMESLKDCSNLPQFEGEFDKSMVSKGTFYKFDNCLLNEDVSFPNHLQPGHYKIIFAFEREPELNVRAIIVADVKNTL